MQEVINIVKYACNIICPNDIYQILMNDGIIKVVQM